MKKTVKRPANKRVTYALVFQGISGVYKFPLLAHEAEEIKKELLVQSGSASGDTVTEWWGNE